MGTSDRSAGQSPQDVSLGAGLQDSKPTAFLFKKRGPYCSTGNSTQYSCGSRDGRAVGGEWGPVHVALSPFAVHMKPSQHCLLISYTPAQNKKFYKAINTRKSHFEKKKQRKYTGRPGARGVGRERQWGLGV